MNKRIIISEDERNRILQQHKKYLSEQDRKSTFGSGQYLNNPYDTGNALTNSQLYTPKDYVQTPNLNLPTQQPTQQPQNNDFRFYDPKTYQTPQNQSPLQNMITQTVPGAEQKPKTDVPVKQKRVVKTSGGGGQQPQQQPAKIDNYQVYGIQDILNKKFNLGLSPDGKWGPKTAQAVLDKLAPAQPNTQTPVKTETPVKTVIPPKN